MIDTIYGIYIAVIRCFMHTIKNTYGVKFAYDNRSENSCLPVLIVSDTTLKFKGVKTMNRIQKIKKSTVKEIRESLKSKGIKTDSKAKKVDLVKLVDSKAKSFYIGVRSTHIDDINASYFGSKKNTYAGKVCTGIANLTISSKKDIREQVTAKYSFNETLARLESEDIIRFKDVKKSIFELTDTGYMQVASDKDILSK